MIEIDGKHYKLEEAWVVDSWFDGEPDTFKKAFVLVEVEDERS